MIMPGKQSVWLALLLATLLLMGCDRIQSIPEEQESYAKVIRMATDLSKGSLGYEQLEYFAAQLQEVSQGKLELALYQQGEWGTAESMLEYLRLGSVEMVCLSSNAFIAIHPAFEIYDIPLLFAGLSAVQRYAEGEQGLGALAILGSGYHPLGWVGNGYLYMMQTGESVSWHPITELQRKAQLKALPEDGMIFAAEAYYQLEAALCRQKWWESCTEEEKGWIEEAFAVANDWSWQQQTVQNMAIVLEQLEVPIQNFTTEQLQAYQRQWMAARESYFAQHSDALTGQWRPVNVEHSGGEEDEEENP